MEKIIEPAVIIKNRIGQSGLWRYSISGDIPIVLVQIEDAENILLVKQMVQAHHYWRLKGLVVDLVILNDDSLGAPAIEARVLALAAKLREQVVSLGGSVAHEGSPILACRFPNADSNKLAAALLEKNIIVSARHGLLRVSVHLYNDEADIERFVHAVREITA